jgi:hypothetical protein
MSCCCTHHFCTRLIGARQPHDRRDPTLVPIVCEFKRTPTECHLKRDKERRLWPKHYTHIIFLSLKEHPQNACHHHRPNTTPATIHKSPYNSHRSDRATDNPNGGAHIEHFHSKTIHLPPHQHQTIKIQEDLQQDSEEEINAIIEDELARLYQENERLRLMQGHLARRKAMAKRSQVMWQ